MHDIIEKEKRKTPVENFNWPVFNTDKQRIRYNTDTYSNLTISEAFEQCYGVKISKHNDIAEEIPNNLKIGDVIKTHVMFSDKNNTIMDPLNYKTVFVSTVNLYKYHNFKKERDILVKIVRQERDVTYVDPIAPFVEIWINNKISNKDYQKNLQNPDIVTVKNLKLVHGGFIGKAVVSDLSDILGEDYTIDAFIPGSQIVLNIPENFKIFEGKSVNTFVMNYIQRGDDMSLVCSAKEVLKFEGEKNLIKLFNSWCEDSEYWNHISKEIFLGKVTGVINSSKKSGVFVEIPDLNITGMIEIKREDLMRYKPHDQISVKISSFEEKTYYNNDANQWQHIPPYVLEKGSLMKCNIKPMLEKVS